MKKRLEADLVSIAHRILQHKNKSDINQLFLETQKLYEKLSVLRFVNEHYSASSPTIGQAEIEKEIEALYDTGSDLPPETLIEMTEVVPKKESVTEEIPTEEVNIEYVTVEKNPAYEMHTKEPTSEKSGMEEEKLTAENVDDLGEFAADIAEQPLEEIEAIEKEHLNDEIDAEETLEATHEEDHEEKITNKEVQDEEPTAKDVNDFGNFVITISGQQLEEIEVFKEDHEEESESVAQLNFEITEEKDIQIPKEAPTMQISFEDLLGGHYREPDFVKVDEIDALPPETIFETLEKSEEKKDPSTRVSKKLTESTTVSLNDKFAKGIDIDLNDRLAFVKHLFGNSNEDYNRVLNQLITFDNFYETKSFIEEMVKPDYNDWKGKDDYAERFMDIVEKKFL